MTTDCQRTKAYRTNAAHLAVFYPHKISSKTNRVLVIYSYLAPLSILFFAFWSKKSRVSTN